MGRCGLCDFFHFHEFCDELMSISCSSCFGYFRYVKSCKTMLLMCENPCLSMLNWCFLSFKLTWMKFMKFDDEVMIISCSIFLLWLWVCECLCSHDFNVISSWFNCESAFRMRKKKIFPPWESSIFNHWYINTLIQLFRFVFGYQHLTFWYGTYDKKNNDPTNNCLY